MQRFVRSFCVATFALTFAASARSPADPAPERSEFMTRYMPYTAFDRLPQQHLKVANADLAVAFAPGELQLARERIVEWVRHRAQIIAGYYGQFPVSSARVLIVPVAGEGVKFGQTFGFRGPATRVMVGEDVTQAQLDSDWVLVHEMVHFAFPLTDDAQIWFHEGQATYIESIARVQAGDRRETDVWREFAAQMPKGLPQPGDQGLDHTHTWGRTYWGGAVFCLLADVEIRQRTRNRFGLQDALRAVVRAGGVNTESWPIEKAIAIGDAATGTTVLHDLYEGLKGDPGKNDLDALWRRLGIVIEGMTVTLDDSAELAGARKAIMAKPAAERM
jgi:hypothetical protein